MYKYHMVETRPTIAFAGKTLLTKERWTTGGEKEATQKFAKNQNSISFFRRIFF